MQSGCGLHVREERSKQMKKRMVILSLTMVLAMGVSACGSQPAEAPADAAAPAAEAAQEASEQTGEGYVVLVMDEENAPVPGATVQFCSDTLCMTGETDETGIASFTRNPDSIQFMSSGHRKAMWLKIRNMKHLLSPGL